MAFLVCYSAAPLRDHTEKKAIDLDQRFYEVIFAHRDQYKLLGRIASLRYKSPTLIVERDYLEPLEHELARLEEAGIAHPQIPPFRAVCAKARADGYVLVISGDMYREL